MIVHKLSGYAFLGEALTFCGRIDQPIAALDKNVTCQECKAAEIDFNLRMDHHDE